MKITSFDEYLKKHKKWEKELTTLRTLILETQMEESIKWGAPTYSINKKNVVGLGAFKNHIGLWFFNGALLEDKNNVLINAQEGKTVAMRQWRFTSMDEIDKKLILNYLKEAISNQQEGKEVISARSNNLIIPIELEQAFEENNKLKLAFGEFTPYKKKEFAEYLLEAKRDSTRLKRLEKIIPMILKREGLNDKYRK
ncbi:YdeI/OmpD-associated family protein [Zhouia amylolytica]|uniref:YdhG-like domain-containing protein n=1 Tax=Zhouia amylolytica AD3 TaxID=1286632 RepID=W2USR0_9FLAO|nr:DUF1801 domain-containing protein [Zhouia amylolytica]ETN97009.1 hypothetical protein P278_04350 [Zhouia amylolytica AD3]